MKLLESTKSKITKDKNAQIVQNSFKIVLVHFDIVNNDCQHDLRVSYAFLPNKYLVYC